ncbi:hypothetical protein EWM64_g2621 [Hericium alpestre]|uniref:Cytochrome P450 n=1 Tax=Hericium alpestre TaxID=135208 RepID=A0A4Z0A4Q3_9AGAM|nr:hypothetical protein EWM64_g2621 [Hericium alpestre]
MDTSQLLTLWNDRVPQLGVVDLSLIGVGAVVVFAWLFSGGKKARTPPGPRPLPILGNMLSIPTTHPWKIYDKWCRDHNSDLMYLRLPGGNGILVLNTMKAATDLLVKRSTIYSDRPQSIMLSDLMGMSWVFGLMQYGDAWKQHRRLFHREFEGSAAVRMHALNAARRLLQRLLNSNVNYARDMQLTTGDMILSATYGITPKSEDDYFIKLAEGLVGALAVVAGGGFLVDLIPPMRWIPRWFPGGGFKKQADEWKGLGVTARSVPFNHVKEQLANGTAPPSVASHFLAAHQEDDESTNESKEFMQNILAEAYLGGAGATVGTLCTFTLAMALNPDVQKRAQAAIDEALHGERLPDFTDFGNIPYIDALINEVLRWHPGAPLGLFHSSNKDDVYEGYLVPKGTFISPNVWAILHDPAVYGEDVDEFRPERFLTKDGKRNDVPDSEIAFGFGRRICPGRPMGRDTLWITSASILATFDITNPVDKEGKPLDPASIEYSNSMSSRPPYFDCTFKLRSKAAGALVQNGLNEA